MAASMPRRAVMTALAVLVPMTAAPAATVGAKARSASSAAQSVDIGPYNDDVLPACVRSRFVHNINGLPDARSRGRLRQWRLDYAVSIDARCIRIVTVASGEAKAWSASALRWVPQETTNVTAQ